MGNPNSKLDQNKKDEEPEGASVPSTPISTPKTRIIENDPRSPSTNIARTPIQVGPNLNKVTTPIIGVINTLISESEDVNKENLSQSFDPRSPSIEFTRTPIVVGENNLGKLRNKNLDNVKKQLTDFSPLKKSQTEKLGENTANTPVKPVQGPILLEVTPITKKLEQQQKRKSYIGLLETNLDYVETNLDAVAKKIHALSTTRDENISEDVEEELNKAEDKDIPDEVSNVVIENQDKDTAELENEIEHECEQIEELKVSDESADCKISEEESPKECDTKIEELPTNEVSEAIIKEERTRNNAEVTEEEIAPVDTTQESNISQSFIHKLEIISPIKETLEKISQIDKEIRDVIAHNPIINFDDSNPSRDFDKKVTNLIYEDQQNHEVLPKVIRLKDDNRAPLTERNVNQHNRQKSVNKLKVSDKPMNKQDFALSKIPVFKDKKSKSKVLKQCENTPPRQKHVSDVKVKKTQWDADSTLII